MEIYKEYIIINLTDKELIEGMIAYPENLLSKKAVLLCSPHPHFAGNMDNNIIKALFDFFSNKGVPILKFNYRGVGKSKINLSEDISIFDYWEEVEEQKQYDKTIEDTMLCLNYLNQLEKDLTITIIGYSFGAIMAMLTGLTATDNYILETVIGIAPPLEEYDFSKLNDFKGQQYLVGASGDFVYKKEDFISFAKSLTSLSAYEFFENSDHFFRSQEEMLCQLIWKFFSNQS